MTPAPPPPMLDPAVVATISATITAAVTYMVARLKVKGKEADKAADVQDSINKGVALLLESYITAMADERKRHAEAVADLETRLDKALARIDLLERAMTEAGHPVPHRS